jgi:CHAD domain-containing protein
MSQAHDLVGYTHKQLKRLNSKLRQSISTGDIAAIHDLRVASRRLDQPIQLMTDHGRSHAGKRLRRIMKRVRRAFRTVRDLDVFLLELSKPSTSDGSKADYLTRLEEVLNAEREQTFSKALRKCQRIEAEKIGPAVERLCKAFPKAIDESDFENQLAQMLAERHTKLLEFCPQDADADLHEARIRLKRYRYALELTYHIKGHKDDNLLQNLVQMQEKLGHWRDHLVAISTISRLVTEQNHLIVRPDWSARLLGYAAGRAESAAAYRNEIIESWPSFCAATQPQTQPEENNTGERAHAVAYAN